MNETTDRDEKYKKRYYLLGIKIVLTLCFTLLFVISPNSLTTEVNTLGFVNAIIVMIIFFILVAFYCRTLQKTLTLIEHSHRKCAPRSVWLMFFIPYNFIEDFFIIYNVSISIKHQAINNEKLNSYSYYSLYVGLGSCAAQILSIAPGHYGQIATLIALVLWIVHWYLMMLINKRLTIIVAR